MVPNDGWNGCDFGHPRSGWIAVSYIRFGGAKLTRSKSVTLKRR